MKKLINYKTEGGNHYEQVYLPKNTFLPKGKNEWRGDHKEELTIDR